MKSRWAKSLTTTVALWGLPLLAVAQPDFPTRQPVRLIVTFAPGGGSDTIARSLNAKMTETLGQTVIVENKPGAGGSIATDYVAKSAPDGYTVLFTVSSHSINQALYPQLPFNTERDLRGVTLIGSLPQVIAVHPSVPANNLKEWIELGRRDPRYRQYASGGVGSPGHFAGGLLQSMGKLSLQHIPYRGAGPAIADVVGNQVPVVIGSLSSAMPHIRSGKLKAIAVTSKERSSLIPEVQTIAETVPGYESDTWIGTCPGPRHPRSSPGFTRRRLPHWATTTSRLAWKRRRAGPSAARRTTWTSWSHGRSGTSRKWCRS
jgi:tripartite-type tricarboxylate transporter receptor subunit TctC